MYGRAPAQHGPSGGRYAPYAAPASGQYQHGASPDLHQSPAAAANQAVQEVAVKNLLAAVAARAATMEIKDILALTAAFTNGTVGPASVGSPSLPPPPPPPNTRAPHSLRDWDSRDWDSRDSRGGPSAANPGNVPREYAGMMGANGDPLPTLFEICGDVKAIKVSVKTNVKSIAGAMCKTLRGQESMVATAVGDEGLNHTIKAMCIGRCYLAADGLDLTSTVAEVQREEGLNSGRCFAVTAVRLPVPKKEDTSLCSAGVGRTDPVERFVRPLDQQTDLRVAGSGCTATLAGAVAKSLREDKEVVITAVGPSSVAKGVEALALARCYVQEESLELAFYPEFQTIIMQGEGPGCGEPRSCVKFHAWPEPATVVDQL
eukprot:gnl/TRDRNA2_/TRDRNA2_83913_c0_seq1.p1 gnl/TRDRNA2_/TRDRNA2_83913_c0~~gnl/TRDRNA2_/TRDRNA2_83913_c0_seq1.p1  ORF type:complete len:400 (-),score=37.19 gnl/TRDRNA2_/TRDRNA2_83913_c0_seq1:41-1162(-)